MKKRKTISELRPGDIMYFIMKKSLLGIIAECSVYSLGIDNLRVVNPTTKNGKIFDDYNTEINFKFSKEDLTAYKLEMMPYNSSWRPLESMTGMLFLNKIDALNYRYQKITEFQEKMQKESQELHFEIIKELKD